MSVVLKGYKSICVRFYNNVRTQYICVTHLFFVRTHGIGLCHWFCLLSVLRTGIVCTRVVNYLPYTCTCKHFNTPSRRTAIINARDSNFQTAVTFLDNQSALSDGALVHDVC